MLKKVSDFGSLLKNLISFQCALFWKKNCYLVKNAAFCNSNVVANSQEFKSVAFKLSSLIFIQHIQCYLLYTDRLLKKGESNVYSILLMYIVRHA